jgi:alcohol dehydrogenase class IV
MHFEFATASRILFGPGKLKEVGVFAKSLGRKALVVTGRNRDRAEPLLSTLSAEGVSCEIFSTSGEPTTEMVSSGARVAKEQQCELVIGFGGGSALDAAKAVAALITNSGELLDYLEVIGKGKPLTEQPAPCIAIPTTAGTGSEVTRNAVLASPQHRLKVSLRSPLLLPKLALVDPELSCNLPPELTASTGLDALTQLIEPFVSLRANPLTDALCREGIQRVARSLRRACERSHDLAARSDMALASMFSGLALANAALGVVHGFAGPIGGRFTAPHGAVCAALLPHAMASNVRALRERQPDCQALERYREIATLITGREKAMAEDGIQWIRDLCQQLAIPRLGSFGMTAHDFPMLIENARNASSMKGNPVPLSAEEMGEILAQAL